MSDCRKCAEFSWCLENEDCGLFKQKPQTNADRTRCLTDEELGEWFCNNVSCGCSCLAIRKYCDWDDECCTQAWVDWLKQEAK